MSNPLRAYYGKRWRILKRDGFTCQYCGRRAPDVILHIDHIVPQSVGGTDEDTNLVTSCAACNIGRNSDGWRIAPNGSNGGRDRKSNRAMLITYLEKNGASDASSIAKEIGITRTAISAMLNNDPAFRRVGRQEGSRRVLFELVVCP